jgi:6,7-dimethyl-8-ribityllumazine synthase
MVQPDHIPAPDLDAESLRIAIVTSVYHEPITSSLEQAAREAFHEAGGLPDRLIVHHSPGAFELTSICRGLVIDRGSRTPDAVIALGCVITGETPHDRYICHSVAQGLTNLTLQSGIPIAFGLLTCNTMDQAVARSGGDHGNKGREAMHAAIRTAHVIRSLDAGGIPNP